MEVKSESIGADNLAALIDAIKNSSCNISVNISITGVQPVETALEPPVEPLSAKKKDGWELVHGESSLRYNHQNHGLVIESHGIEVRTTWKYVKQVAELDKEKMKEVLKQKYPDEQRVVFLKFLKAYREGRVAPMKTTAPVEPEPVIETVESEDKLDIYPNKDAEYEPEPDISTNNGSVDWSKVPSTFIGDTEYKERNGKIRLRFNNDICCTTWDKIVQLAAMPSPKLKTEVIALYPAQAHRNLICAIIDAYRQGIIRDPDEQYRRMIGIDTSTRYDGGEIECESAY